MNLCGILVFLSVFSAFLCQVHYVPAQILIPTINGTQILTGSVNSNPQLPPKPPSYYQYNYSAPNNNDIGWNVQNNNRTNSSLGHLIVGNIQQSDRLLFNQEYFKDRRWWTGREKIIEYPGDVPGGYVRHETISAIRAYNKFYDGSSARATILKGGVGHQFVKLQIESKRNHGFKFLVQIFGH